jgi:hypothetical protein
MTVNAVRQRLRAVGQVDLAARLSARLSEEDLSVLVLEVAKHIDKNFCGEMFPHAKSLGDFSVRKHAETYPLFSSWIYTISYHREEDVCDETDGHRQFLAQRSKIVEKKSGALKSPVCFLRLGPRSLLTSEFLERWQDKRVPPYGEEIKAE